MKDGGPAFPCAIHHPGMTLRDYYAGHAVAAILANNDLLIRVDYEAGVNVSTRKAVAHYAYAIADEMLADRDAQTAGQKS